MEARINHLNTAETLGDYAMIMLEAITELESLRARRTRRGKNTCGVVYSTISRSEVEGLKSAMQGVYDYYASDGVEGVIPEFKSTETPHKWYYGVDLKRY